MTHRPPPNPPSLPLTDELTRRAFLGRMGRLAGGGAAGLAFVPGGFSPNRHGLLVPTAVRQEVVVDTSLGRVRGTTEEGVSVFKGIPYGANTTGANRWMPPRDPEPWTGVRDALEYGPTAAQGSSVGSEDCLVMNVFTPGIRDEARRPVMLWLHGGGFRNLSSSSRMYDGVNLCNRGDVVVCSVNHRLNVFGYLHLGDIAGEQYRESGNVGMLDIIHAMHWIQDNIGRFGGDPSNVTIFGESGGGRKVTTLLGMPGAAGLFHRAIIQSGAGIKLQPRDRSTEMALALLRELGLSRSQLSRLHDLPMATILGAYNEVEDRLDGDARNKGVNEQHGFVPTVGVPSLPTYAFDPVAPAVSADIPILVGSNQHELAYQARGDREFMERTLTEDGLRERMQVIAGAETDRVLDTYRRVYGRDVHPAVIDVLVRSDRTYRFDSIQLAQRKAAQGRAPVWMYLFAWETPVNDGRMLAHHALEITFAFDNVVKVPGMSGGGARAAALADKMSDAWIAFARHGNPNTTKLPRWNAYQPPERQTMVFDDECTVVDDPHREVRELWATL